ncbi:MAG: sugar-binding transcriptional regulator [Devosiaceae bacterium]|nr:sugar-binding transcriptional regulator [Devosiaceae bacterium MH13]
MLTNVNRKASPRADRLQADGHTALRAPVPVPARFRGDPAIWAAWLYYRENMTQADIGKAMGVSRATVNAYIAEARGRGVVSVRIDPSWLSTIELSEQLADTFGLEGATVVPTPEKSAGRAAISERIGRAGAELLGSKLAPGDFVAVAWGRTVLAMAEAMGDPGVEDLTVAQLTGGTTSTFDFSPEFCASVLAERLNARCQLVTAPVIVSSPQVRTILMEEPILAQQFDALKQTDIAVFGVCTTYSDSLIFSAGVLDPNALPRSPAGEAVAVVAGRCIDPDGEHINDGQDARVIGLPLDHLKGLPCRIAVAGGPEKTDAIHAVLRGGYPTHLVTDENTARALLERM